MEFRHYSSDTSPKPPPSYCGIQSLNDDDEIDVWRAALESIEDSWLPAAERWQATNDILDKYPPRLKLDLGLLALRAAIEKDDGRLIRRSIRRLTSLTLSPYDEARVDAMKALKAERAGDLEKARALLTDLTTSPNQTVRAVADFQLTALDLKAGSGDPTLLQSLNRRLPIWRGHPQERIHARQVGQAVIGTQTRCAKL